MEKLQGSINPYLLQEELGMSCCFEEENGALYISQFLSNTQDFEQGNEPYESLLPSLEDNMPFLQMLQGVESHHRHYQQQQTQNTFFPLMQEPNFQFLLKLQHQKSMIINPLNEVNQNSNVSCLASGEPESCVTNNNDIVMDLQSSPIAPQISTMDPHNVEKSTPISTTPSSKGKKSQMVGPTKEKKKRKRTTTKPSKNKEEIESQRMTHIAVERNRRRQMNEHLNALRSLMPPSYVQRGDQASIIGGAIDFVKELEQLLQSLEAQKRMRKYEEQKGDVSGSSTTSSASNMFGNMFTVPSTSSSISALQYKYPHSHSHSHSHDEANASGNGNELIEGGKLNQELRAENRSALADIQVIVIQNHVNLKIRCQRRAGQLLNAIVALEQLRLTVLHLNITSMHTFVYYSFSLKIEEECKLGSADEVASAIHQIFRLINSC